MNRTKACKGVDQKVWSHYCDAHSSSVTRFRIAMNAWNLFALLCASTGLTRRKLLHYSALPLPVLHTSVRTRQEQNENASLATNKYASINLRRSKSQKKQELIGIVFIQRRYCVFAAKQTVLYFPVVVQNKGSDQGWLGIIVELDCTTSTLDNWYLATNCPCAYKLTWFYFFANTFAWVKAFRIPHISVGRRRIFMSCISNVVLCRT